MITFGSRCVWQQEQNGNCHGGVPGGMNKLVVGIFFEEDEAEEAAADDGDTWHEEAAGVLHAGVADALGRAVRYLQQEIKM